MTTPKVRLQKWSIETKIFIRLKIIIVFAVFPLPLPCVSLSKNPHHFPAWEFYFSRQRNEILALWNSSFPNPLFTFAKRRLMAQAPRHLPCTEGGFRNLRHQK